MRRKYLHPSFMHIKARVAVGLSGREGRRRGLDSAIIIFGEREKNIPPPPPEGLSNHIDLRRRTLSISTGSSTDSQG